MNNVDIPGNYKKIVRYFWDPEPKNDVEPGSSIWCLGREYPPSTPLLSSPDRTNNIETPATTDDQKLSQNSRPISVQDDNDWVKAEAPQHVWPPAFLDDFGSIMWLTYRSNFPAIPKSNDPKATFAMSLGVRLRSQLVEPEGFTSDTGWGCMIRSGQSLLANALSVLSLGRDWRRGGSNDEEEKKLLSLFADDPRAPFSIHRFVEHGASACGKHPGQWFGPSATARCIEALSSECKQAGLNVYVTSDGSNVYEDKFRHIAQGGTDLIRPTVILLGIRLGIDRITPIYWDALKEALKYSQSVGIAGGRPSSSHYFVGVQGSHFFYLDPHHTRPALPYHASSSPSSFTDEELESYHTRRLRRLHISEMDPSMLVGFLIRNEEDWSAWKQSVQSPPGGKRIFHIFDSESAAFGPGFEREGAVDEVEALDDFHCDNGNNGQ